MYHLNSRTMQKILKHPEPPEKPKEYVRAKPKLGPFISVIHETLEADKKVHKKQRHTGKRIFERLRDEHDYTGGITAVRDEIRRYRQQATEVFMPLAHPPGEAQFDFGEAKADWADPGWFFCFFNCCFNIFNVFNTENITGVNSTPNSSSIRNPRHPPKP